MKAKKIDSTQHGFWERFLINIPFVLMITLMIALFGGALLLIFYSVVLGIAFKSAMISIIVLGVAFFAVGCGLLLIIGYKKYYVFYEMKMNIYIEQEVKTVTDQPKTLKDYLSLSNIAYVILGLGAVFCIISGLLGCTDRTKWVDAISPYMNERGYFEDIKTFEVKYYIPGKEVTDKEIEKVELELKEKNAVIIYNEDEDKNGYVIVSGYYSYENQVSFYKKENNSIISIKEGEAPKLDSTLDKLLFFIWNDNIYESQIKIYIPLDCKDKIEITGEYIIAQN